MGVKLIDKREPAGQIEQLEDGKIMAKKADLVAQGKMKTEGETAAESEQATDSTGVVPNTSQGRAIAEGKGDLLTHAYPGTEAWNILEEGMNGDAVSVTAKTDFLDHTGQMRLRGETFSAPSRFANDWQAKKLVSIGGDDTKKPASEPEKTDGGGAVTATVGTGAATGGTAPSGAAGAGGTK